MKKFWRNKKKDVTKTVNSMAGYVLMELNNDNGDEYKDFLEDVMKCKMKDLPEKLYITTLAVLKNAPEEVLEMPYDDFIEKVINGEIEDW